MEATYIVELQEVGPWHVGVHPCHYQFFVVSMTTTDDLQKHSAPVTVPSTEHSRQPPHNVHRDKALGDHGHASHYHLTVGGAGLPHNKTLAYVPDQVRL